MAKTKQKRAFSAMQPTSQLHIGNYIGALKQWAEFQDKYQCIYGIVDLHAITVPQDPKELAKNIQNLAALYIAGGIDPEKSIIFVQSHNPDHAVLAWLLSCVASVSQLKRMTQYKTKSEKLKGEASVALFDYPILMAADILLYQADIVPVGDDQKQHVELTRDLANRFNNQFGQTFKIPESKILKVGARIMSLQNPTQKMSKSDPNQSATLDLLDTPDEIMKKVQSAVTDSGREIKFDEKNKAGISNLLAIYSQTSDQTIQELEQKYQDRGYGEFKKDLAETVITFLKPMREKYQKISQDPAYIKAVLREGLEKIRPISQKTLQEAYEKIGLR